MGELLSLGTWRSKFIQAGEDWGKICTLPPKSGGEPTSSTGAETQVCGGGKRTGAGLRHACAHHSTQHPAGAQGLLVALLLQVPIHLLSD